VAGIHQQAWPWRLHPSYPHCEHGHADDD
jgi:hypothetical protein